MDWKDIASIIGIAAIMISGANWVIMLVARGFWNLTIKKMEERIAKLEVSETRNEAFRHRHEASIKSLMVLLETFKSDIDLRFDNFEKLILSRIDAAVLRQEIQNQKNNL